MCTWGTTGFSDVGSITMFGENATPLPFFSFDCKVKVWRTQKYTKRLLHSRRSKGFCKYFGGFFFFLGGGGSGVFSTLDEF